MWKFLFDAEEGTRILEGRNNFFGVTLLDGPVPLWWSENDRKWMPSVDIKGPYTNHAPVKGFRAFKRHLRNHPELQGLEVVLTSRFFGYDIYANWVE